MMNDRKPVVKLLGEDSNAFYILGTCKKAGQRAGFSKEKLDKIMDEMKSGDYDNLMQTAMKYFEVE